MPDLLKKARLAARSRCGGRSRGLKEGACLGCKFIRQMRTGLIRARERAIPFADAARPARTCRRRSAQRNLADHGVRRPQNPLDILAADGVVNGGATARGGSKTEKIGTGMAGIIGFLQTHRDLVTVMGRAGRTMPTLSSDGP
jgi:hypothetical protein